MANLANAIERYLKRLLAQSETGTVSVQRNQLAETFSCAPSQISYVLATRFLLEHGYLVETRRGGGGYVRITLLRMDSEQDWRLLLDSIGEAINQGRSEAIINRLQREGIINEREAMLMRAGLSRAALNIKLPWRDMVRADILRAMLIALQQAKN